MQYYNHSQVVTKRACGEQVTKDQIYFFLSTAAILRVYLNVFLGQTFAYVPQVIHSLHRIQVIISPFSWKIKHFYKVVGVFDNF